MYRIPENKDERHQLREICGQILGFENYYLTHYRTFLLTELRSGDKQRQRFAFERLHETHYPDEEMQTILQRLDLDGYFR